MSESTGMKGETVEGGKNVDVCEQLFGTGESLAGEATAMSQTVTSNESRINAMELDQVPNGRSR